VEDFEQTLSSRPTGEPFDVCHRPRRPRHPALSCCEVSCRRYSTAPRLLLQGSGQVRIRNLCPFRRDPGHRPARFTYNHNQIIRSKCSYWISVAVRFLVMSEGSGIRICAPARPSSSILPLRPRCSQHTPVPGVLASSRSANANTAIDIGGGGHCRK
jgi:hypothetical protein